MTKLTAADIDERVNRVLSMLERALARGDIDEEASKDCMEALAKWSVAEYAKLPQVQAFEAITNVLFGVFEKARGHKC